MFQDLSGKAAIVTGGSLGIGSAIAVDLGSEGVNVALNYRKHSREAEEIARRIREEGGRAMVVQADVSSFEDAQNMAEKVREEFGRLDILVCNAGINRDGVVWKMSEEQWDRVIDVNLKGYFNYIRAVTPFFREQK
jgi:3-oxoacyl-[acyl-carrier protein] reductase